MKKPKNSAYCNYTSNDVGNDLFSTMQLGRLQRKFTLFATTITYFESSAINPSREVQSCQRAEDVEPDPNTNLSSSLSPI